MADPHHVAELDGFDRLTVVLYRAGLVVAAAGILAAGVVEVAAGLGQPIGGALSYVWLAVTAGTAAAVCDMHLYDKRVGWVIRCFGWAGVVLQVAAPLTGPAGWVVFHAGLGFIFAALSGFALKEQFCFRIPGLRLVPILLAVSLIPLLLDEPAAAAVLLLPSGTLYCVLAVAKLRMPLHFDVGDKSKYQV